MVRVLLFVLWKILLFFKTQKRAIFVHFFIVLNSTSFWEKFAKILISHNWKENLDCGTTGHI